MYLYNNYIHKCYAFWFQMLMNVLRILISVVTMLLVWIQWVAIPVVVIKGMKEMGSTVLVRSTLFSSLILVLVHYYHVDINECLMADVCDPFATCENTPGSYNCTCNYGYTQETDMCICKHLILYLLFVIHIFYYLVFSGIMWFTGTPS